MTVTNVERARLVLTTLNNGIVVTFGNLDSKRLWMNQEDVLSTMIQVVGKGMDKVRLRQTLENLTKLDFLEKQEPKFKTQSKWEYQITQKGKDWLLDFKKLDTNLQ